MVWLLVNRFFGGDRSEILPLKAQCLRIFALTIFYFCVSVRTNLLCEIDNEIYSCLCLKFICLFLIQYIRFKKRIVWDSRTELCLNWSHIYISKLRSSLRWKIYFCSDRMQSVGTFSWFFLSSSPAPVSSQLLCFTCHAFLRKKGILRTALSIAAAQCTRYV